MGFGRSDRKGGNVRNWLICNLFLSFVGVSWCLCGGGGVGDLDG